MKSGIVVEFVRVNDRDIVMLYLDPSQMIPGEDIHKITRRIADAAGISAEQICLVRNGSPSPYTNNPKIRLAQDDEASRKLIKKIVRNNKPGAIILLSDDEMEAARKMTVL